MKLREQLQDLDPTLNARLSVVERNAKSLQEYSQGGDHLSYTPHGYSHVSAVERNYDWLLSDADISGFNAAELFALLAATFLHDIFMIPPKPGLEFASRRSHALDAPKLLQKHHNDISISPHEALIIGEIIRGHGIDSLQKLDDKQALGTHLIDIRKLAACLSMADICHADESRAPRFVFNYLELSTESEKHWRRHMSISGITRNQNELILSAIAFSDEGESSVREYKSFIEKQLGIVRPYFSQILYPITKIELKLKRYESRYDKPIHFDVNTPAIVRLLVEGVYERNDVFIRELIQNSIDACTLRSLGLLRHKEPFSPTVVVTEFKKEGRVQAIRVDDNGVGMTLEDIQDTVLSIGSTVSDDPDVKKLLADSRGQLIASFGIGMLSCFKVVNKITVITRKEGAAAVQVVAHSVSDPVVASTAKDQSVGTTVFLELKDSSEINTAQSISHYVRNSAFVQLRFVSMDYSADAASYTRDQLFKIASTGGQRLGNSPTERAQGSLLNKAVKNDHVRGVIWIPSAYTSGSVPESQTIEVLNSGVFVCDSPAESWFPSHLACIKGQLDFVPKSIDLPVSRDSVMHGSATQSRKSELQSFANDLIADAVKLTGASSEKDRNGLAVFVTWLWTRLDAKADRSAFLGALGDYHVAMFGGGKLHALRDIAARKPKCVYLIHPRGRFVKPLMNLDGKELFQGGEDLPKLQATIYSQDGEIVIQCARVDPDGDAVLVESSMLEQYFKWKQVPCVNISDTQSISSLDRARSVPAAVRVVLGDAVRFVDLPGVPMQRAWKNGSQVLLNIANPSVRLVYETIREQPENQDLAQLASILFDVLSLNLDRSVTRIEKLFSQVASREAQQ